jgi:hypothetical protein
VGGTRSFSGNSKWFEFVVLFLALGLTRPVRTGFEQAICPLCPTTSRRHHATFSFIFHRIVIVVCRVASAWLIAVDCRRCEMMCDARVGVASESERAISTTPSAVPVPYAGELTTRLLGVGASSTVPILLHDASDDK